MRFFIEAAGEDSAGAVRTLAYRIAAPQVPVSPALPQVETGFGSLCDRSRCSRRRRAFRRIPGGRWSNRPARATAAFPQSSPSCSPAGQGPNRRALPSCRFASATRRPQRLRARNSRCPEPRLFQLQPNPLGGLPRVCRALGDVVDIDMDLVVPDKQKVHPGRGHRSRNYPGTFASPRRELIASGRRKYDPPVDACPLPTRAAAHSADHGGHSRTGSLGASWISSTGWNEKKYTRSGTGSS